MPRALIAPLAILGSACLLPDLSDLTRCSEGDCTGGAGGSTASSTSGGIAIVCDDAVEAFPEIPGLSFDTSSPEDVIRRDLQLGDQQLLALAADVQKRWRPVLVDFSDMSVANALEGPGVQDGSLRAIALGQNGRFYSASAGKLWKSEPGNVYGVDPQGLAGLTALFVDPSNEHVVFVAVESGATETQLFRVDTESPDPPMQPVATLAGQPAAPMTLLPGIATQPHRIALRMRDRVTTCVFDGSGCTGPVVFQQASAGEAWLLDAAAWAPNEGSGLLDIVLVERLGDPSTPIGDPSSGRLGWFLAEMDAGPLLPTTLGHARAVSVMQSLAPEIAFAAEVSTEAGSIPVLARCPLTGTIAPDLSGCSCVASPQRATAITNDPKTQTFYFQSGTTLYRWPNPP
jgi:hypothetical protein